MGQSLSCEANRNSVRSTHSLHSEEKDVYICVHKNQLILSHIYPIHSHHIFKVHFILFSYLHSRILKSFLLYFFLSGFPTENRDLFIFSPIRAKWHISLLRLHLIVTVILGNFMQPSITSSLLVQNISLSTLLLKVFSLCCYYLTVR